MKKSEKIVVMCLSFCLLVLSCKENSSKQIEKEVPFENEDMIDKIIIQFLPSFNEFSLMLLDLSKREQTFQRIGQKKYYRTTLPRGFTRIIAPKSINFQLDSLSYSYFRNISFDEEDFIDKEEIVADDDNIYHSILYVFKSGKIEDVDLKNSLTENEYKLIIKLIDLNIVHSTDSLTTKYLKGLRRYHARDSLQITP